MTMTTRHQTKREHSDGRGTERHKYRGRERAMDSSTDRSTERDRSREREGEVDYFELFCRQAGRRRLSSATDFGGSLPSSLATAGSSSSSSSGRLLKTPAVSRGQSLLATPQTTLAPNSLLQVPPSAGACVMRRTRSESGQDDGGHHSFCSGDDGGRLSPTTPLSPGRKHRPAPLKLWSSFKSLVDSCDGSSPCMSPGSPPDDVDDYHKCPRSAPPSRSSSPRRRQYKKLQRSVQSSDCCEPPAAVRGGPTVRSSRAQHSSTESAPDSAADLRRVRQFVTTSRGIVNCGDSFRSKSMSSVRSLDSSGSVGGSASSLLGEGEGGPPTYHVAVLGAPGAGKTTLAQQLITSECVLEKDVFHDCEESGEWTVSVLLNGDEATLHISEVDQSSRGYYGSDAYLVTYATNDRASFHYAADVLYKIREEPPAGGDEVSLILVANKTDLVRGREVAEQEGRVLAETYSSKYMEISSLMNLRVDELLAGTLNQIRLRRDRPPASSTAGGPLSTCTGRRSPALRLIGRILKRQEFVSRSCENLLVL